MFTNKITLAIHLIPFKLPACLMMSDTVRSISLGKQRQFSRGYESFDVQYHAFTAYKQLSWYTLTLILAMMGFTPDPTENYIIGFKVTNLCCQKYDDVGCHFHFTGFNDVASWLIAIIFWSTACSEQFHTNSTYHLGFASLSEPLKHQSSSYHCMMFCYFSLFSWWLCMDLFQRNLCRRHGFWIPVNHVGLETSITRL